MTSDGSHRTKPDLSAPGVSIRGAVPGNGYAVRLVGNFDGGPACRRRRGPAVAGNPASMGNIGQTESNMEHAATHLTDLRLSGNCRGPFPFQDNTFGWGLLNLLKAVTGK